ncbi:two-component system response regulator [Aquabacterium sp.]|uniref:response regulator n=1 Tax=Aquabacterium sp. TaxID=1872578 RepID=UPI0035AF3602
MSPVPHILVVDDDELTREMLQASLTGACAVTAVASGAAALQQAQAAVPDLVLLDVDMPEMNGYATCEALLAEGATRDVPVIFLSACVTLDERLRGYQAGAVDYLTKPFDVSELRAKIKLAIAQRDKNRDLNAQLEDVMNAAMTSADMYGEVGVVLEFQRRLSGCYHYADIARAVFDALERCGFEGSVRLNGRQGVLSMTGPLECSALENSLLDHIEKLKGASIQPVGGHTAFNYGQALLVRNLPMGEAARHCSPDDADRFGRARDNVALLVEGALGRIRSLDIETKNASLENNAKLVKLTREALIDISAQQHATRLQIGAVFQRMREEIEHAFIHLGLSDTQEDLVTDTLARHTEEVMKVFDHSQHIEQHLHHLIGKLGTTG